MILPIWLELSINSCALEASSKGKAFVDLWLDQTTPEQLPDLHAEFLGDVSLDRIGPSPKRGAGMNKTFHHEAAEICFDDPAIEEGNLDDASFFRCDDIVFRDVIAANHVKNDIYRLCGWSNS